MSFKSHLCKAWLGGSFNSIILVSFLLFGIFRVIYVVICFDTKGQVFKVKVTLKVTGKQEITVKVPQIQSQPQIKVALC